MVFEVTQREFKGPLEVLLDLIERRKLHISDVALSKVADDFLFYIKSFTDFPMAESAQFALVASTLLLIKSRSLLPVLSLTGEEEASIEDLERRLVLYKRFRALSRQVGEIFGKAPLFLPNERVQEVVFAPQRGMTVALILSAMRSVLAALPRTETLSKATVRKIMSLEEMIVSLTERVKTALRMSFKDFTRTHKAERVNVIVSFLAMLELVKQGIIAVAQEGRHGDIMMETGEVSTPRY